MHYSCAAKRYGRMSFHKRASTLTLVEDAYLSRTRDALKLSIVNCQANLSAATLMHTPQVPQALVVADTLS